jgi:uncharacterized protein YcgL (UPF0745 family)
MSLEFTIEIICAVRGAKSATLFGAFLNKKEDFRKVPPDKKTSWGKRETV